MGLETWMVASAMASLGLAALAQSAATMRAIAAMTGSIVDNDLPKR